MPTLGVAVITYSGWLLLTLTWRSVPLPLLFLIGGLLIAWHLSLQHECLHGHPTKRRWLNTLIAGWPLGLWLPYALYRESHLAHHRSDLTDPLDDPESFYVRHPPKSAAMRRLLHFNQTLIGRLSIGPALSWIGFFRTSWRRREWLPHFVACVPVVSWLAFCEMPLWLYVLCFSYPGLSWTLLRSFAEHRPAEDASHRSIIVEAEAPLALLFLNNNLHAVHHAAPGVPWYELPKRYETERDAVLQRNGGYHARGYRELAKRFLFRMKDSPVHPKPS